MGVFVFDMDDVLRDLRTPIQKAMFDLTGIDFHWSGLSPDRTLADVYGDFIKTEWPSIFERYRVLESGIIEDGVIELFDSLRSRNDEIHILTHCGWHKNALAICTDFLAENSLFVDSLIITDSDVCKAKVLSDFPHVSCFVDDRMSNVRPVSMLPNVNHSVLMARPWNTDADHVDRIVDIRDCITRL